MYVSEVRPDEKLQNMCFDFNMLKKFVLYLPSYILPSLFQGCFYIFVCEIDMKSHKLNC